MFTCQADKLILVSTSYSVVMLNTLRSDVVDVTLTQHTKSPASKVMESETDQDTGYKKYGGLTVTGIWR